jgi:hypothetical protein
MSDPVSTWIQLANGGIPMSSMAENQGSRRLASQPEPHGETHNHRQPLQAKRSEQS